MLTQVQIDKFNLLYRARFGLNLSSEEALEKGAKLVRLIQLIYPPTKADELNQVQKNPRTNS